MPAARKVPHTCHVFPTGRRSWKRAHWAWGSGNHPCPQSVASTCDVIILNFSFFFKAEADITFLTRTTGWLCSTHLEKSPSYRVPPYFANTLMSKRSLLRQLSVGVQVPKPANLGAIFCITDTRIILSVCKTPQFRQ